MLRHQEKETMNCLHPLTLMLWAQHEGAAAYSVDPYCASPYIGQGAATSPHALLSASCDVKSLETGQRSQISSLQASRFMADDNSFQIFLTWLTLTCISEKWRPNPVNCAHKSSSPLPFIMELYIHHCHIAEVVLYRSTGDIEYAFIHAESTSDVEKIMLWDIKAWISTVRRLIWKLNLL